MDAAPTVDEPVVDRFAGLTFGGACEMLFLDCKSNAPSSEGFQNMIDYIGSVYRSMGLEFSCDDYWNKDTISGSHEVFPAGLGQELNTIPDVLTKEYLEEMITRIGDIETANRNYRQTHERVVNRSGRSASSGYLDSRVLNRVVNSVPVYVALSEETDDEDDFI